MAGNIPFINGITEDTRQGFVSISGTTFGGVLSSIPLSKEELRLISLVIVLCMLTRVHRIEYL